MWTGLVADEGVSVLVAERHGGTRRIRQRERLARRGRDAGDG